MDSVEKPILEYLTPSAKVARDYKPFSGLETAFHLVAGLLLPLVCFLFSARWYPLGPDHQRGRWYDCLGLIPRANCSYPFYPFLAFSIISLLRILYEPKAGRQRWCRLGLFTGVILAFQYALIQAVCILEPPALVSEKTLLAFSAPLLGASAVLLLGGLLRWAWDRPAVPGVLLVLGVPVLLLAIGAIAFSPGILLLAPLFFAPALTLATFLHASYEAVRIPLEPNQPRPRWIIEWVFWGTGYGLAWRVSAIAAVAEYAKLPKSAPDCYIATAAARGHPWLVGSRWVSMGERTFAVSEQLQFFKAAELILRVLLPTTHRVIRLVYNRLGPPLANRMTYPILADLAYLSLKPAEWLARATLAVLLPDLGNLRPCIYTGIAHSRVAAQRQRELLPVSL